ncbi:MAG TPA: response regulator transcription factor [Gaiellaceae bacterium]|nr:response regulator transcription factor [Gaiellaceae bacterium]
MAKRIVIADGHPLLMLGILETLERDGAFEVVGTAATGAEVLPRVGELMPDAVLLESALTKVDGLGCLSRIRARFPEMKVVMLSASADPDSVRAAFEHGADGYIVKSVAAADLAAAIRQAIEGSTVEAVGQSLEANAGINDSGLTEREMMIVKAVARGLSNSAIGRELWIAEQTVKFHLTNIFRKLGVRNRTDAARWAFACGLIDATLESASTAAAAV